MEEGSLNMSSLAVRCAMACSELMPSMDISERISVKYYSLLSNIPGNTVKWVVVQ